MLSVRAFLLAPSPPLALWTRKPILLAGAASAHPRCQEDNFAGEPSARMQTSGRDTALTATNPGEGSTEDFRSLGNGAWQRNEQSRTSRNSSGWKWQRGSSQFRPATNRTCVLFTLTHRPQTAWYLTYVSSRQTASRPPPAPPPASMLSYPFRERFGISGPNQSAHRPPPTPPACPDIGPYRRQPRCIAPPRRSQPLVIGHE